MKNPLMQFVAVFTFAVFGLPYGHAVAAEPPGAKEPLPATRTFFIEGVSKSDRLFIGIEGYNWGYRTKYFVV